MVEGAGAGALGAVTAQHMVLLGGEQLAPLGVGVGDAEFGFGGAGHFIGSLKVARAEVTAIGLTGVYIRDAERQPKLR